MKVVDHKIHNDNRGSYTPIPLDLLDEEWSQCSISTNDSRYTFRGLHYQTSPQQTKCIKVIQGKILDIWVDLKTDEVFTFKIDNSEMLYIPNTYAHGYLTLEPNTIVAYLVKGKYNPDSEHSIIWKTIPKVKNIVDDYLQGYQIWISDKDRLGK